ncbi:hypothetical protein K474DRAFT_1590508 [Panus rudis PR-1116 ss-1]|nr:hypothetical protein K474DRAFT_1590508 [Panus rudis PR-1116 ss-1]
MDTDSDGSVEYTIEVFDLWTCERARTIAHPPTSTCPAIDFARHGLLTRTATSPSIALSFNTLEHFHRLRCRKPSFSTEAFAKVLCDTYKMPYHRYLRDTVADTYEIYLRVVRAVEKQVYASLGRDSPQWRPLNACRACCYKLEDEPTLRFSRLWAFDGNDSLKCMSLQGNRVAGDTRTFTDSDYFLSRGFVNQYAGEVKSRTRPPKGPQMIPSGSDSEDTDDDLAAAPDCSTEGDPTDGCTDHTGVEQCVKNWKAAAAEEKKKAWGIFDETGIFASACRHGLILWLADMVQSGELAKYPLAMIAMVNNNFDPDSLLGYNIACTFWKTILNSSLGPAFKAAGHKLCVNAFHGYTHSYDCQVQHHPNVTQGVGLEDLETLERVFSASNQLAPVVRHASPYQRRQLIDAYFRQWDEDKYLNSGTFILNNYKQALQSLEEDTDALAVLRSTLSIDASDEALDAWAKEEKEFFATLGDEHPWDTYAVAYVELLQRLRQLESDRKLSANRFYSTIPSSYEFSAPSSNVSSYAAEASNTAKLERRRQKAVEEYDRVHSEVIEMEIRMNIAPSERWTPSSPQYISTLEFMEERQYHKALEKVQRLVIQHLFELHKLNLAQTGYKLRTHLAKSLQTRCKTIRKAVAQYNTAAAKLTPPRPPLDWSQVSHYGFLEEFLLLQDTRNDIHERPWGNAQAREAMKLRRRIERAKEEIERCNVEVRRLHTAIVDEAALFRAVLQEAETSGDRTLGPLQDFVTRHLNINEQLLSRVEQIYALPGFTGMKGPGVRLGHRPLPRDANDYSQCADIGPIIPTIHRPTADDSDEENDSDDETHGEYDGLIQFFSHLTM